MFDTIIIWAAKTLASYAINKLVQYLGHTAAGQHITAAFENAKALHPDITLKQSQNPNLTNHFQ